MMPSEGPRLAPKMSDTTETAITGTAVAGSTHPIRTRAMRPGTSPLNPVRSRIATATRAPTATSGIHHHCPENSSEDGSPKKKAMPVVVSPE
jgi:hypothetical protein